MKNRFKVLVRAERIGPQATLQLKIGCFATKPLLLIEKGSYDLVWSLAFKAARLLQHAN